MNSSVYRFSFFLSIVISILLNANGQRYDNRAGVPEWQVDSEFKQDVFTFARVQYSSGGGRGGHGGWGGRGRGWGRGGWATDYPDAELNFAFRLQQMTSLKVNPDSVVVELTQRDLFNYPFLYIIEPGRLIFMDDEVTALRKYLLNGGFLMVDDFWGDDEYDNFYYEMKRVFPDREPVELSIDHPIFHMVFDLKEKPQVPSVGHAVQAYRSGYGIVSHQGYGTEEVHYKAIFDDNGRIMCIICHNTDLGDGWEREGEDEWYFREFAEKRAYPMGINIIFYAMTH
tara:strand:- start:167 stop:1018 length:852 start_codon:yes stop_codon:yes gene_type:complete